MGGTILGATTGANQPEEELAPGTEVGEYRIESKIGHGGMGVVYAAIHPIIGKKAAVKVISRGLGNAREAIQRFILEAQAVNRIAHPNIVDIFSLGTLPDGRPYFVMELLRGENVASRLKRGTVPLGEALEILGQVGSALDATHRQGIIHRDLKPENVFIDDRGDRRTIKLLDFGIAKLVRTDSGKVQITQDGTSMGTPTYASPELARGRAVDERGDIYSLGVMAFEIILGHPPFHAAEALDLFVMHVSRPPPLPSKIWTQIPPELNDLLLRMLAKDPRERPPLSKVREVLSGLEAQAAALDRTPRELTTVRAHHLPADLYASLTHEDSLPRMPTYRGRALAIGLLAGGVVIIGLLLRALLAPADVPMITATPATMSAATHPSSVPSQAVTGPATVAVTVPGTATVPVAAAGTATATVPVPVTAPASGGGKVRSAGARPTLAHEPRPRVRETGPAPADATPPGATKPAAPVDDGDSAINPYGK